MVYSSVGCQLTTGACDCAFDAFSSNTLAEKKSYKIQHRKIIGTNFCSAAILLFFTVNVFFAINIAVITVWQFQKNNYGLKALSTASYFFELTVLSRTFNNCYTAIKSEK